MHTHRETAVETPVEVMGTLVKPGRGRAPGSRRTQFQKGHPGHPRAQSESVVYEAGSPLEDMRHALTRNKVADETPGQRAARKLLEKDFRGFVLLLEKLEAGERLAPEETDAGSPVPTEERIEDASARRVGELLERLLKAFQEGVAK